MEKEPSRFFIDQTCDLGECRDKAQEAGLYKGFTSQLGSVVGDDHDDRFNLYKGFTSQGENIRLKARYFLEKVFSSHPVVAQILKNDPPFFRAAHAHLWGPGEWK